MVSSVRAAVLCGLFATAEAWVATAAQPSLQTAAARHTGASMMAKMSEAELRRQRLEIGTNWPPRTSTVKGEGYQFFQGPTPKTGVQEDLPSFFSGDNFADLSISPVQIGVTITGLISFAIVASTILTDTRAVPQMATAPAAVVKEAPPKKEKKEKPAPAPKAEKPAPAAEPAPAPTPPPPPPPPPPPAPAASSEADELRAMLKKYKK